MNRTRICSIVRPAIFVFSGLLLWFGEPWSRTISLDEALQIAVNQTARGGMIRGNQEVAEQKYSARRINYILPEISINGSLPALDFGKTYGQFGQEKGLYERRTTDFQSFIELRQSLLTGGDLSIKANLLQQDEKYPDFRSPFSSDSLSTDKTSRGFFDFSFSQPLLKPSSGTYNLRNAKDEMGLARIARLQEETALRQEVARAYIEGLQLIARNEMVRDRLQVQQLQAGIDSLKLGDGIISEETYLTSVSNKLDAELASFEQETDTEEKRRELALLLDFDVTESLELVEPPIPSPPDSARSAVYVRNWEQTLAIQKAELVYEQARRKALFEAGGRGLTADLAVNYSIGRGTVETDRVDTSFSEKINTSGWGVQLNFRYPVFDGGAGSAAVRASNYLAEQARLEFERARKTERAALVNLINQITVSYRRLSILSKQLELARQRKQIADGRYADGQISQVTLLESRITVHESRISYLTELSTHVSNVIALEGAFSN